MTLLWISLGVGYVACGVLAYALTLGHFQQRHPLIAVESRGGDIHLAVWMGASGPIGLITALMAGAGAYPPLLRPLTPLKAHSLHIIQVLNRAGRAW